MKPSRGQNWIKKERAFSNEEDVEIQGVGILLILEKWDRVLCSSSRCVIDHLPPRLPISSMLGTPFIGSCLYIPAISPCGVLIPPEFGPAPRKTYSDRAHLSIGDRSSCPETFCLTVAQTNQVRRSGEYTSEKQQTGNYLQRGYQLSSAGAA